MLVEVSDCLDSCVIDLYIVFGFYQSMFTLHWNYYDVYAHIPSLVTITDSAGMSSHTRVYVVRCAWAPTVVPYLVR
jgi:hypothetical protein